MEKLRIDAEVKVFWLAAGELQSYELIINGACSDIDWEIIVNEALRDEDWWEELQTLRGKDDAMASSQDMNQLAHIIDSTSGRPGVYNPHEDYSELRRPSAPEVSEIPKKPATALLAKMGVSMGIHTQHLGDDVFQESSSEASSDVESSEDESEAYPMGTTASEPAVGSVEPTRQPLLAGILRRRGRRGSAFSPALLEEGDRETTQIYNPQASVYGTMSEPAFTSSAAKLPTPTETSATPLEIPQITEQLASPESLPKSSDTVRPGLVEAFPSLTNEEDSSHQKMNQLAL